MAKKRVECKCPAPGEGRGHECMTRWWGAVPPESTCRCDCHRAAFAPKDGDDAK